MTTGRGSPWTAPTVFDETVPQGASTSRGQAPPPPAPPPPPPPPPDRQNLLSDHLSTGTTRGVRFAVAGAFSILGEGTVVVGEVREGTLRKGMGLRVERAGSILDSPARVEVRKIVLSFPHRGEASAGQYGRAMEEVGPGAQVGVGISGAKPAVLKAGDFLVA